jgi:[calcium/calmodulin-dependent protein kinase] kinase
LIDFGQSERYSGEKDEIKGRIQEGTPKYFAPELFGESKVSGRPVDIWAAGVTLYTIATGEGPFKSAINCFELRE